MSYILDALKKAETERGEGAAPAPHFPPIFQGRHPARGRWSGRLLWALPVALAGALIGFGWLRWQRPAPAPAAPVPKLASAAAPEVAVPPPKAKAPARSALIHGARHAHAHAHPAREPKEKAPAAKPAAAPVAPAAEASVASLRDLPAAIRQRIPPLATSGYLYAGNPADRSVVLNNRLLREGDRVAPGLTLEKLLPDGMVLNYEGHRFRTGY